MVSKDASGRDRCYLERAIQLGRKGWGRVHPNPMVGCVIVQDETVVGEGWHRQWGGDHAEVDALGKAGDRARGATVYVSLEPCRHHGKTPPCTRALMEAGVARVVYGAADPGAASSGGGEALRRAGVDVTGPLLSRREARRENPAFFHEDSRRPWTALKLAVSLDGGIAEAPGKRTRITGEEASRRVQRLRAGFDAILVGAATARTDDPLLTVRGEVKPRRPPRRVVADGRGTLPGRARLLREGQGEVHLLTTEASTPSWRLAMEAAGAQVLVLSDPGPTVPLDAAMRELREGGVSALLCEGGGVLGSALLSAGLVDRLYLAVAPRFLGKAAVPAFPGAGREGSGRWRPLGRPDVLGDDLWIELEREA